MKEKLTHPAGLQTEPMEFPSRVKAWILQFPVSLTKILPSSVSIAKSLGAFNCPGALPFFPNVVSNFSARKLEYDCFHDQQHTPSPLQEVRSLLGNQHLGPFFPNMSMKRPSLANFSTL